MGLHQSIRAVLLDYGGVIADEGMHNGLRALAREQNIDIKTIMDAARAGVYDTGFVLGTGTAQDFWAVMRERAGLRGSDKELSTRILDGFVLRPWMIALVRQWRAQGLLTGILSDQTHWLDWLNERDGFYDAFDQVFNSYTLGKGKRDPGLFHDMSERLALPPQQILFVDDMKSNIERARAAGWQAIHYTDKAAFMHAIEDALPSQSLSKSQSA